SRALETGHVYVNRSTTAARPGVEPFGGLHRSGTGPKAGYGGTLWAYVHRADAAIEDEPAPQRVAVPSGAIPSASAGRWDAPLEARVSAVIEAAAALERVGGPSALMLRSAAEQALRELGRPADTVPVAGQHTE